MADNEKPNKLTIFQRLDRAISPSSVKVPIEQTNRNKYTVGASDIFKTKNQEEFDRQKLQAQQNLMLSSQWKRVDNEMFQQSLNYETTRIGSYVDFEAMEYFPEIAAALDLFAEECCTVGETGKILNIYSDDNRIKGILDDLFYNRLQINTNLFPWTRNLAKYGDEMLFLNIDDKAGIIGVRQMPNIEMERREGDLYNMLLAKNSLLTSRDGKKITEYDNRTKFFWKTKDIEFNSWQIAHFRLFGRDIALPYGTSMLEKSRRIWRLLIMAEDSMLQYRVTRSAERRVFKVYVGNIDDKDVPAYMDKIANEFKRKQLIDPSTGQMDLRANVLSLQDDFFIPIRDPSLPMPIETLPGANNLGVIDDILFLQNKLFVSLETPKPFLGFDSAVGDGKNLALLDVRFGRKVTRIQQSILMELNKIATIHLYLLGLEDELDNFTLTLNNPSTQASMLKIEHLQQKLTAYQNAVADAGNGFGAMSMTKAKKEILGMSEGEIRQDLLQQRVEKAAAAEIAMTESIIKHTGLFDEIDNIMADPMALQQLKAGQLQPPAGGEKGKPAPGGGGFGGGTPLGGGEIKPEEEGEKIEPLTGEVGAEGGEAGGGPINTGEEKPEENANQPEKETPQESIKKLNNLLTEEKKRLNEALIDKINRARMSFWFREQAYLENHASYYDKMMSTIVETSNNNTEKINEKLSNKSTQLTETLEDISKEIEKLKLDE